MRRISQTIFPALLGLSLLAAPPAHGQLPLVVPVPEGVTLPAHPSLLLSALPESPPGWEMTTSRGENLNLSWFITDVERAFIKVQLAEDEDPAFPPVTRIRLRDTGNYPGYLIPFANFRPAPADSASPYRRRVMFGSVPGFVTQEGSTTTAKLLIAGRYLVDLDLENQPPSTIGTWLEAFDTGILSSIDNTPRMDKPARIRVAAVDELNPENDNVYISTITRVDMALKTAGGQYSEEDLATLAQEAAEQAEIAAEIAAEMAAANAEPGDPPADGAAPPGEDKQEEE